MIGGSKGSLFDSVEDMDSVACLEKLAAINAENSSSATTNTAFVFIKPHAVTDAAKELVKAGLAAKGIKILSEGSISSEEIDSKKLIDQHYYAIASKATILKPAELNVPADKFKGQFGIEWQAALDSGKVMNAMDGCATLGLTADEMDTQWGICKKAKKMIKFGGGFYCGLIELEGKEPLYIFNGFFMSMRSKFTAPGLSIYYYVVEWDGAACSWADFRGQVLGPTDPAEAPADSLRGQIMAKWQALGLAAEPDVGDNGVHASASPFEALAERTNWVGATIADDSFGKSLIGAGVSEETIKAWSVDPQVMIGGSKGSLFDSVEDMDSVACLEKLAAINAENL
jgi:nucleoside diphosphate kinase